MMKKVLETKTYAFAIRIVRLVQYLQNEKKEFVLSKQVLRSGTCIGAMTHESEFAQSKADFVNKLSIALKEANETTYWVQLLKDTDYLKESESENLLKDIAEIISLLVASIKTAKKTNNDK